MSQEDNNQKTLKVKSSWISVATTVFTVVGIFTSIAIGFITSTYGNTFNVIAFLIGILSTVMSVALFACLGSIHQSSLYNSYLLERLILETRDVGDEINKQANTIIKILMKNKA